MEVTRHLLIVVIVTLLVACSEDPSSTNAGLPEPKIPIHKLEEGEAKRLLEECLDKLTLDQEEYSNKMEGQFEAISEHTDESYRSRVPSSSYASMEKRLKQFVRFRTLNLSFAYWGSERTPEGHLSRYVLVRHCRTNGRTITDTLRSGKIKLAR